MKKEKHNKYQRLSLIIPSQSNVPASISPKWMQTPGFSVLNWILWLFLAAWKSLVQRVLFLLTVLLFHGCLCRPSFQLESEMEVLC